MTMASHCEMEIERNKQKALEGEPYMDQMAQQVNNFLKLKIFYDKIDFDVGQCLSHKQSLSSPSPRRLRPCLESPCGRRLEITA